MAGWTFRRVPAMDGGAGRGTEHSASPRRLELVQHASCAQGPTQLGAIDALFGFDIAEVIESEPRALPRAKAKNEHPVVLEVGVENRCIDGCGPDARIDPADEERLAVAREAERLAERRYEIGAEIGGDRRCHVE